MIIACYAGVGKSTFAKMFDNSVDLVSMPYSWILPKENEKAEYEEIKAAPYLIRHPHFYTNYLLAILEANKKYEYVLIPTIEQILRRLENEFHMPFIVVYPSIELKEQYKQRYIDRGNTQNFLEVFIEQWDDRIHALMEYDTNKSIVLSDGEYLTNVKEKIDNIIQAYSSDNQEHLSLAINRVQQELKELGKFGWLYFSYRKRKLFVKYDVTNTNDREIIFKFGKLSHEKYIPITLSLNHEIGEEFITMYKAMGKDVETIEDVALLQNLMNVIENNLV